MSVCPKCGTSLDNAETTRWHGQTWLVCLCCDAFIRIDGGDLVVSLPYTSRTASRAARPEAAQASTRAEA